MSLPAPAARLDVHVWFEADPADDASVATAVARLIEAMTAGSSDRLAGPVRLLRRPDLRLRDGRPRTTWMEVWPGVPGDALAGWLDRLAHGAEVCGVSALAHGGRHVEPFVEVARAGVPGGPG